MNIQFLQRQEYAFQHKVPVSGERKSPISQKSVGVNKYSIIRPPKYALELP